MKKLLLCIIPFVLLSLSSCSDDEGVQLKLEIDKTTLAFTKAGGYQEIEITSNQRWEIIIDDQEWLTASTLSGEGDETVRFTATPYDVVEERHNVITIKNTAATIVRTINVTQDASNPRMEVDKKSLSYNYEARTEVLKITSNTAWKVIIKEADNWLTTNISSGTGDGEVILTIPIYYGAEDRSATILLQCTADNKENKEVVVSQRFPATVGVWILSEGSATKPTADLAYYDVVNNELKSKFYSTQNGETLGQIANYMGLYGSKLYIAISGPPDASNSSVKVVDPKDGKLIKTIPMKGPHAEGDVARQMVFHGGKVYVTSYFSGGKGEPGGQYSYYGGVVRIDTTSLSIEASTRVGDKPEGITYHDNKLFVCNNETGNGKTISIVDVESFTEITTIPVPENPTYIQTTTNGEIYFSTLEIYSGDNKGPSALHKLDPKTYEVKTITGARASRFAVTDRYIYTGEFSYSTFEDIANKIERKTNAVESFDLAHPFFMIYSFDANPATGDIYIGGQGDDVIIMSQSGEKLQSLNVKTPFVNQFIPILE